MGNSNRRRRFGVTQDVELENRLLSIERELAKLAPLDRNLDTKNRRMIVGAPPQVTGLVIQQSPGTITGQWNRLNATNVSYYEVQIADNAAFNSAYSSKEDTEYYTYQNAALGDLLSTFYVRVRAVINNTPGPWSATVSSALGKVVTESLVSGAVSVIAEEEVTTFNPSSVAHGADATWGSASVTTKEDGVVDTRLIFEVTANSIPDASVGVTGLPIVWTKFDRMTIDFLRDPGSIRVARYLQDLQSPLNSGRITVGGFSDYDTPGIGTFTYKVKITLATQNGAGDVDSLITPIRLVIQLRETLK